MLVQVVNLVLSTQRYSEGTYCYPLMLDRIVIVVPSLVHLTTLSITKGKWNGFL